MEILELMEQEIERCQALFDENIEDSFYSYIYSSRLKDTRELTEKLRQGETPAELIEFLHAALPRAEQALQEEEEHPRFDWYDEHYYAKLIMGQIDAYKAVLKILENASAQL